MNAQGMEKQVDTNGDKSRLPAAVMNGPDRAGISIPMILKQL